MCNPGLVAHADLPPALAHDLSSQEHALDAGASVEEEPGVPADVAQHEVLGQQVYGLPPGGPLRLLLLRVQRSLQQHQVAHFPGNGEHQEGVEDHREVVTQSLHPAEHFAG